MSDTLRDRIAAALVDDAVDTHPTPVGDELRAEWLAEAEHLADVALTVVQDEFGPIARDLDTALDDESSNRQHHAEHASMRLAEALRRAS